MTIPESVPSIILNNNSGYDLRGENVAEILSMTIDNECDLYGTISISDGLSTQYLFKKSRDESVKTRPGERLLLTGPDRGPRADDGFEIHVDLKNAAAANDNITDTKLTYSFQFDAPVTGEIIVWDSFSHWPEKWNTVDQTVVKGEFGSLTAKYIVFAQAIMAKVEVILLKKGDHNNNNDDGANAAAKVYGEITVQTVGNPIDDESVIFKKASDELIDVSLGQPIPLLRSVIPVPKDGYLSVYVDISTSNRKLTRDIRDFYPPQFPGTSQFDLGNLMVKVTWDRTF